MKGFSPLIASVLLIAIGFTVASVLSPWAFSLVEDDTEYLSNKSSTVSGCNPVTVADVYLDFNQSVGRMYVVSTGDAVVTTASIVNTEGVSVHLKDPSVMPITLSTGNRQLIEFNLTLNITSCSNFSKASVVTTCLTNEVTRAVGC
jgi:flagellin-like protein